MLVDAGSSMDENYCDNTSRLKLALTCIKMATQQKIFNNPSHEIALAIFGDREMGGNLYPLQTL